ncbi:MAG: 50S ribosomal protein L23 [Alphaproteobacteria bacterium]|nr:50S ribosomal protein L23 [Alphaproteobacteria bacterium]
MAELHDILVRPIVTEKSSRQMAMGNTYVFEVGVRANKIQIKHAIEQVFGVSVEDVRTVNVRGKTKRFGRFFGKRPNWKKAYVRLADGDSLNFYEA